MTLIDILRIGNVELQFLERHHDVLVRSSDSYGFVWFSVPLDMDLIEMKEKISKILHKIQELHSKEFDGVKEIKL